MPCARASPADHIGARAQMRDFAKDSNECGLGWIGYESGSSTHPITLIALACISKRLAFAGEGTSFRSPPARTPL